MKPGWQTTEFWTTIFAHAFAAVALLHPGFKAPPDLAQGLAVVMPALATVAYTHGRSMVKAAAAAAPPATPATAPTPEEVAWEIIRLVSKSSVTVTP
jgi:hypothetical protein